MLVPIVWSKFVQWTGQSLFSYLALEKLNEPYITEHKKSNSFNSTMKSLTLKVHLYSALFAMRCGILSHSSSNFNCTCGKALQHMVNNAE